MLEVTNICKSFPGRKDPALLNVSFAVNPGEAVAIVGENGAGKTTLIRILSMILKPDRGAVTFNRVDSRVSPGYFRQRTGTLFSGDGSLYDRLTAEENILYHAKLNGIDRNKYHEIREVLFNELAISHFAAERVSTFSRGMKQRTAIAKTLITDPELVILDEPSTGLDIIASEVIKGIINRLKESGKTVLFSSHNTGEVFTCADRIIVIHKGYVNCDMPASSYITAHGTDLSVYIGGD